MNYLNPYSFWGELSRCSDLDVATANGMASITAHQGLVVRRDQRLITNSGLGHMGSGLPLAVGACVASKRPLVCATGDGSIMFNIQELETIVYHKLPIKIFIFNNGGYWCIRNTHLNYFGKPFACDPKTGVGLPDFRKIAKAFGIKYYRISNDKELSKVNKIIGYKGATICELIIDPNQELLPTWTAGQYRI